MVASAGGDGGVLNAPSQPLKAGEGGASRGAGVLELQCRVAAMQEEYGEQLNYLVTEFTKLEAQLAPEVDACLTVS